MTALPEILSVHPGTDEIRLLLAVPATLEAFAGHFPGQPILPGVVQIDWALSLAVSHLGLDQPAARDFQVKFRRVIQPGAALSLSLRLDTARRALSFEYRIGDQIASSGRIKLEAAAP